jgi:hypothetical protein
MTYSARCARPSTPNERKDIVRSRPQDLDALVVTEIFFDPKELGIEPQRCLWIRHLQVDVAEAMGPDHIESLTWPGV